MNISKEHRTQFVDLSVEILQKAAIEAIFRDRGFHEEDRDHFCYAYVKPIAGGWLYVGKWLEEGGSDLPVQFSDKVYVEVNGAKGDMLSQRTVETLTEYLAEGR